LELEGATIPARFVRLKVHDGQQWDWMNYPVKCSRHFQHRMREKDWKRLSPTLVLRGKGAALHFPQAKEVQAARVVERMLDPHLVTVGVDLNFKHLAVVTGSLEEQIIKSVFLTDHGLDQARYRHLQKIAKKQWQTHQGGTQQSGSLAACQADQRGRRPQGRLRCQLRPDEC